MDSEDLSPTKAQPNVKNYPESPDLSPRTGQPNSTTQRSSLDVQDKFVMVKDPTTSVPRAPFVKHKGSIYPHGYAIIFPQDDLTYVMMTGGSWELDSITFDILDYSKTSKPVKIKYLGVLCYSEDIFEKYASFYQRMLLEFFIKPEDKKEQSLHNPLIWNIGTDASKLINETQFSFKNYIILPGTYDKKTEAVSLEDSLITSCQNYWQNTTPAPSIDLAGLNPQVDILQTRYGKQPRYTICKIFPKSKKMKAIDLYNHFMDAYRHEPPELETAAKFQLDKKFHFKSQELKQMTVRQWICALPEIEQTYNDFCCIRQIEKYHNFDEIEAAEAEATRKGGEDVDDCLIHLMPVMSGRSIISTYPKENTSPLALNSSLHNQQSRTNPKARVILLYSRFVKKHPLQLTFWHNLCLVPLVLFEVEKRLINIDVAHRFGIKLPNVSESLIWRAMQTKMADRAENYETLETLGDSILKFVITIILYSRHFLKESKMTYLRMRIICNYNLVSKALHQQIHRFMYHNHKRFAKWNFPLMRDDDFSAKGQKNQDKNNIGNQAPYKMLADVIEALIGAIFLAGERRLDPVLEFLMATSIWPEKDSVLALLDREEVPSVVDIFRGPPPVDFLKEFHIDTHDIILNSTYSELFKMSGVEFPRAGISRASVGKNLEKRINTLEEMLGYKFKKREIAAHLLEREANDRVFERYEFLGDSAIEMRAVELAFTILPIYYKMFEPHDLHKVKIYMLSNHNLSFFTSFYYLDTVFDYDISEMCEQLRKYSQTGMFGQFLRHDISTIKILGDTWESTMAAVLIDGGWAAFDQIYTKTMMPFICYICKYCKHLEGSAKSAAFEVLEKKRMKIETAQKGPELYCVKVVEKDTGNVLKEFEAESADKAQELCYFYLTYQFVNTKNL